MLVLTLVMTQDWAFDWVFISDLVTRRDTNGLLVPTWLLAALVACAVLGALCDICGVICLSRLHTSEELVGEHSHLANKNTVRGTGAALQRARTHTISAGEHKTSGAQWQVRTR